MENTFGSFLRQKRQEKNLTQKELSKLLFVSESTVSKWEKDVAHPDITLLPKLSEILSVSEHELITASVDNKAREEKNQAKKWRVFSLSWSLFFYIAYGVALGKYKNDKDVWADISQGFAEIQSVEAKMLAKSGQIKA